MLNTRINDTNSVESDNAIENTYTDENRKKNNIEIVFAVLLILLPRERVTFTQAKDVAQAAAEPASGRGDTGVRHEDAGQSG
jgi:hypothetical protein